MKILVDLNLSPTWIPVLAAAGFEAIHWSLVGSLRAPDAELMAWARSHDHIVFTNDLDFSAILATTEAVGPSVFQVRTQDLMPSAIGPRVIDVLREHEEALAAGAIVTLDTLTERVRILPISQSSGRAG